VVARLDEAQIANARMNDMAGLWAHPQLQARDRWRGWARRPATVPALLPPGRSNAFDYRMDPVPAVGQHTEPSCANWATARPPSPRCAPLGRSDLRRLTKMQHDMTIPRWVGTNFIH
jgi:crotonobetainyl-CoA:carnitine CoA-transferase CaiB-like acyl-CoA transferase